MRSIAYFCTIFVLVALVTFSVQAGDQSVQSPGSVPGESEWTVLFDGTSTEAFRGWNSKTFPVTGWKIEGDCLKCEKSNGRPNGGGGDIVTKEAYGDFELQWEWKIAPGGNSGVKYMVRKRAKFSKGQELFQGDDGTALVGHEYQMIDDQTHSDVKKNGYVSQTASFYKIIAPENGKPNPPGKFNESRILVQDNHVEHWLNGVKVLEYELGSDAVVQVVQQSKYQFIDRFGEKMTALILFQDHGDEIWLRNIRIRKPDTTQRHQVVVFE